MKLDDDFPYVDSPPQLWRNSPLVEKIGERHYMVKSRDLKFHHWINQLHMEYGEDLIPLQWVASYIGVSRASVLKRVKNGGLTTFSYELTENYTTTLLGDRIERDNKKKFDYVLITECMEWQYRLYERAARSEKVDSETLDYFAGVKNWLRRWRLRNG
jgi:hypothetical protein